MINKVVEFKFNYKLRFDQVKGPMTDKRKTTSRPSSITKNGSKIEMMFPKQSEAGKPLDLAK
jgi:hypothetical protein